MGILRYTIGIQWVYKGYTKGYRKGIQGLYDILSTL